MTETAMDLFGYGAHVSCISVNLIPPTISGDGVTPFLSNADKYTLKMPVSIISIPLNFEQRYFIRCFRVEQKIKKKKIISNNFKLLYATSAFHQCMYKSYIPFLRADWQDSTVSNILLEAMK